MRKICYIPEWTKFTKSITATLLMAQLEFWFNLTKGKSFYKFLAPCTHELYREGDSWQEELGMSSAEIRTAFKKIGVMYPSKSSFMASTDRFQGKFYAAYYDRIRRTTHYFRNTELLKVTLGEEKKAAHTSSCAQEERKVSGREEQMAHLPNVSIKSSGEERVQAGLYRKDNKENNIKDVSSKVIEIYNLHLEEELGHKAQFTPYETQLINKVWERQGQSLEFFEKLFTKVAESRFLCGQKEGCKWKASLEWLLQEAHINKIMAGGYQDFEVQERKVQAFNHMYSHEWDFDEIERLERLYIQHMLSEEAKVS